MAGFPGPTSTRRPHVIRLRPKAQTLFVSQGRTVLAMGMDGFLRGGAEMGLFVYETRLLSHYEYLIDDQPLKPVALSNVSQHSWLGYYIVVPPGIETMSQDFGSGMLRAESEQTLEVQVSRMVGQGIHEDIDLTNYSLQETRFRLSLKVDGDFADLEETRRQRQQHGKLKRRWEQVDSDKWQLVLDYHAHHDYDQQGEHGSVDIHRSVCIRFLNASSPPSHYRGTVSFDVELGPRQQWHACIEIIPNIDGREMHPIYGCRQFTGVHNEWDRRSRMFLEESTQFRSPESSTLTANVISTLEQAKLDLAALRLFDLDRDERSWVMAGGLPVYVAVFGRDILTAAWQSGLASSHLIEGALLEIPEWQGREVNDWRDEQPGRMLHEAHTGPLSTLNYVPHARDYGSHTSSGFYPFAVAELWHWTGDRQRIEPLIEPALKALQWMDDYGDLDGDGFYEYQTRSKQGVKNQAWKDSPDAIVYEDGSQVETPIATCETQAFVYGAKLHFSEVLWSLGRKDEAKRLYHDATELKKRFNELFWMPDEKYYALGLDPQKRLIRSIASNPGHCLASGIVDKSHVEDVVQRLMSDELFSGWGIRTLSCNNPAYNPYSYHRGSVWPVAQGTFALSFYRWGLHEQVERLAKAQIQAAALFDFFRLPEVISGHRRDDEHPFPAMYPEANSPQAWSSSTVFLLLQAMLGLYPYAPLNMLLVDPWLPEWLPEITLEHLHVGDAKATIRFYRKENGKSSYEVLDCSGSLHILRQPSPWSLTASFGERLVDTLSSLLPGK